MQGYALGTLSAFLSALAAVYTEWVMKRTSDSLYWQNMQLYSFGVVFNALGLTIGDVRSGTGLLSWHGRLTTTPTCGEAGVCPDPVGGHLKRKRSRGLPMWRDSVACK